MRKFIIMGQPLHDNLGDMAIWYAEKKFLGDNFKDTEVISFPEQNLLEEVEKHKDVITDEDVLFMQGGGNLGNQYLNVEGPRREIIRRYPNNPIIMFPQTVHFTDDEEGRREIEKSREVYSSHKNLTMIIREKKSLEIAKEIFPDVKVVFLPDIVTYLYRPGKFEREGALLVLRGDAEKHTKDEEEIKIKEFLNDNFSKVDQIDISKGKFYDEKYLLDKLFETLDLFSKYKLVITDRLHGMIFSFITKTPCIAMKNYNHKVESFYDWFDEVNYIELSKNVEDLEEKIIKLKDVNTVKSNESFQKEFDTLKNIIKEIIK